MTWPIRGSTNAFSPESLITRNLTEEALRQAREINKKYLERNSSPYSSEDESKEEHSQLYEDMKKHLFSMSSRQRDSRASTNSSFSSRNIKQNNTPQSRASTSANRTFSSNNKNEQKAVEASTSSASTLRGRTNTACANTTKSKDYCSIQ
ncbi:MAG: hypothetical protein ACRDDW_07890 [Candidatus Rhabdochlamydia sp.]